MDIRILERHEAEIQEWRDRLDAAVAQERRRCADICDKVARHAVENGNAMKEYGGNEGRLRELGASYAEECAILIRMATQIEEVEKLCAEVAAARESAFALLPDDLEGRP